jgi:hypothetical protein
MYERYKIIRASFVYEPTVAATTSGSLCGACFDDPTVDVSNYTGLEAVRAVASQMGGETFQVWGSGCFSVPPSKQALYTDPNGADIRLSAAGSVAIVASTDIAGGVSPGQIYLLAEVEYSVPSVADASSAGDGMFMVDSSTTAVTAFRPFVTLATNRQLLGGDAQFRLAATFSYSGTVYSGNVFTGLPAGDYMIILQSVASTLSAGSEPVVTDEGEAAGVEYGALYGSYTSNADSLTAQLFSIPPGIGKDVPLIALSNITGSGAQAARCYILKVNEGFLLTDGAASPAAAMKVKRKMWFDKTAQGIQATQTKKLNKLVQMSNDRPLINPAPIITPLTATSAAAYSTRRP